MEVIILSGRVKAFSVFIIIVPQIWAFCKKMEWQYNLILLLTTMIVILIIEWDQLGELFFTKDGFGIKIKQNVDELKMDMDILIQMNKPLFIGHIETKRQLGKFDVKSTDMILNYFSKFYSEDKEIIETLKSYKERLIQSFFWRFGKEEEYRRNLTNIEIQKEANAVIQEWIINNDNLKSNSSYVKTKDDAFYLRDNIIEICKLFEKNGI